MSQTAKAQDAKFSEVQYKAGDYIFQEKSGCNGLYIIKSGQIQIFRWGRDQTKIPLGIVGSGEYLGEMGLLSGDARSANAQCLTDVTAIMLPTDVVLEQLKQAPQWLVSLTKGLAKKLKHANDILKRNGLIDESLLTAMAAIEQNEKRKRQDG